MDKKTNYAVSSYFSRIIDLLDRAKQDIEYFVAEATKDKNMSDTQEEILNDTISSICDAEDNINRFLFTNTNFNQKEEQNHE